MISQVEPRSRSGLSLAVGFAPPHRSLAGVALFFWLYPPSIYLSPSLQATRAAACGKFLAGLRYAARFQYDNYNILSLCDLGRQPHLQHGEGARREAAHNTTTIYALPCSPRHLFCVPFDECASSLREPPRLLTHGDGIAQPAREPDLGGGCLHGATRHRQQPDVPEGEKAHPW